MTKRPKTTAQQLTRLFLKLFIAILFVVNLAFVLISTTFIYHNAQDQAHDLIENVQKNIEEEGKHNHYRIKWDTLLDAYIARQDDDAIKIVTPDNKSFYSSEGKKLFKKINKSRNYNNVIFASKSVYYLEQAQVDDYQIAVALNIDGLFELVVQLLVSMLILNLLAIIVCIPLIRRFAKKWSFSLEKIDHEILQIQHNNTDKKTVTVPKQPAEIKRLAQSFNGLLSSQDKAIQREKQFVSDASHELKTPVAAIRGHINLIKRRGKTNPEIVERSLNYIDSESLRMQQLVNELLEIGRAGKVYTQVDKINLVPIIKKESDVINQEFQRKVHLQLPDSLFYPIELNDLRHLVHNLLENAAKYSEKGTQITLNLQNEENQIVLQIKDEGQGIKPENYDKIFDRFFREDESHSSKIPGTGLGLAIVKSIVEKYHGQIKIISNQPQGTIFVINFPR